MALNKINYVNDQTIITAQNLNDIQNEIINLDKDKINKSGDTINGNLIFGQTSGIYLSNNAGTYPVLYDNGSNLWIGAKETADSQKPGGTFISCGHNNNGAPRETFYAAVANDDNTSATSYSVWHNGYINYDKIFPVGSCYTMSTNENPSTIMPGTTWTLIDKKFKGQVIDDTSIFTINSTNTTKVSSAYAVLSGNMCRIRISVVNKVAYTDDTVTPGNINFDKVGVVGLHLTSFTTDGYCDAANAIPIFSVNNDTGVINIQDVVGVDSTNTGLTWYFNVYAPIKYTSMLDSFCDQFIFKRTA